MGQNTVILKTLERKLNGMAWQGKAVKYPHSLGVARQPSY